MVLQTHDEPRSRAGCPISAQASIALRGCPTHARPTRGSGRCTARSSLPAPARRRVADDAATAAEAAQHPKKWQRPR